MPPKTNHTRSFYLLPEWVALAEQWWQLQAERVELTGERGGVLRAVLYRRGSAVVQPPGQAYLAMEFIPTPTDQPPRITGQWHEVATLFSRQLQAARWRRWLVLPPSIDDPRPFSWEKLIVSPRYTYLLDKTGAANEQARSPDVRRRCKRALEDGYRVEHNADVAALTASLKSTQDKQGFEFAVSETQIAQALASLGPERFRIYNAYATDGQPASSMVVLYTPGAPLQEWIAGTAIGHLKSGVSQLVFATMLADIQTLDTPCIDFCGANIPSVAAAKHQLGGTLTPCYMLEPLTLRYIARSLLNLRGRR